MPAYYRLVGFEVDTRPKKQLKQY